MAKVKIIITMFILSLLTLSKSLLAEEVYNQTFMSVEQAQNKFGNKLFSNEKFKKADRKIRGEMAADLILKKSFIGKPLKSVKLNLGSPDGFYENKSIPAYIISQELDKKDIWQLVFIPDQDWKKIEEVKIHKNCCE